MATPRNPYNNCYGEYWHMKKFDATEQPKYETDLPDGEYNSDDLLLRHDKIYYNKCGVWIENESPLWSLANIDRLVVKFEDGSCIMYNQKKWPRLIATHVLILPL